MADKPTTGTASAVAAPDTDLLMGASMGAQTNATPNLDPLTETAELANLKVDHFGLFRPIDIALDAVRAGYIESKKAALGQKPELTLASAIMGVKNRAAIAATEALANSDLGESRINDMRSFSTGGRNVNS